VPVLCVDTCEGVDETIRPRSDPTITLHRDYSTAAKGGMSFISTHFVSFPDVSYQLEGKWEGKLSEAKKTRED